MHADSNWSQRFESICVCRMLQPLYERARARDGASFRVCVRAVSLLISLPTSDSGYSKQQLLEWHTRSSHLQMDAAAVAVDEIVRARNVSESRATSAKIAACAGMHSVRRRRRRRRRQRAHETTATRVCNPDSLDSLAFRFRQRARARVPLAQARSVKSNSAAAAAVVLTAERRCEVSIKYCGAPQTLCVCMFNYIAQVIGQPRTASRMHNMQARNVKQQQQLVARDCIQNIMRAARQKCATLNKNAYLQRDVRLHA